jgi:tripartite-type tricarboxylate transporter receptor subunit TctC
MKWTLSTPTFHHRSVSSHDPAPALRVTNLWRRITCSGDTRRLKGIALALAFPAVLVSICSATAQVYPSRPITTVVAGPAGGPTDAIGRTIVDRMEPLLGQPIVMENSPSSGGVSVRRVVRATPDGYTVGLGNWSTHVVDGAVLALPFDLLKDLEPISLIASNPLVMVSRNTIPAGNLRELITWLKANPGATLATPGAGRPPRIAGAFFQDATDTRLRFVPYRGAAQAMQDLIGGHVDLNITQAAAALPQVRSGTIRAYAVTSKERLASAPDIPAVDEAGVPGFHLSVWHGLWAPRNTPKGVIATLNSAVVGALADQSVRQRLVLLGQDIPPREQQTPEALGEYQKAEIEKWWPIIKAANIGPTTARE